MSITISIIEDHHLFRTALGNLLNDHEEMEVLISAENGQDYLLKTQNIPVSDVVLVDFEMPIMDGPETVRQIKQRFGNDSKILGLSVHKELRLVNEMLEAGANGFISKDVSADELFLAIRNVLAFDFYISPAVAGQIYKKKSGIISVIEKDPLSEIELEMLRLICEQKTNREIADQLSLSNNTINAYRTRLLDKTGMKNSAGLVVYAIQEGIYRI